MSFSELLATIISLFLLIALAIYIYTFLWFFILRVPFVRTKDQVVDTMIKLANLRKGQKVYDLGCGDGKILFKAAKHGVQCIGIERAYPVYLLGEIRNKLNNNIIQLKCTNIFDEDFSDADVIFTYLLTPVMQRLYEKKLKHLKKGTKIISNTFRINGLKEKQKEKAGRFWIYVYEIS